MQDKINIKMLINHENVGKFKYGDIIIPDNCRYSPPVSTLNL